MAAILQLGGANPAIDPELKEFLDACLVPILVRNALKEIRASEPGADLESTASCRDRCASGGFK